jgi:hypothetical protein
MVTYTTYMHTNRNRFSPLIIITALFVIGIAVVLKWYLDNRYRSVLVDKTYCSDVCPDQTRTFKVYKNINNQDECEKIGGQTIKDAAWGGYIGCQPRPDGEPAVIEG